jgi:excisionase family DNA binding protein
MPKRLPEDQDLFRVKDAAPYFDVHEKTLREMVRRGEVQTIKHGPRKTYIATDEIKRYWRGKSA